MEADMRNDQENFGCVDVTFSMHAEKRTQQRAIRRQFVDLVWDHGDREEPAGGGCFVLSISTRRMRLLISKGAVNVQDAARCQSLKLVTDGSLLITAYRNGN
jgi:hypothetical protein